jgi:hypothetical protein
MPKDPKHELWTAMISPIICICNACNLESKSPYTKLLELTLDCSISLYIATLNEKITFKASNNNLVSSNLIEDTLLHTQESWFW